MENIPPKPQIHEHSLRRAFLVIALLLQCVLLSAQENPTPSDKVVKFFERALVAFEAEDFDGCEGYLQKVIREDSTFTDGWILLGDLYCERNDLKNAATAYRIALSLHPEKIAVVRNLLANTLFVDGQFRDAATEYELLLKEPGLRDDLRIMLEKRKETALFRQFLTDNPVAYVPENLGDALNTSAQEYINCLRTESDELIFTRKSPKNDDDPMQREFQEDFYRSFRSDSGWTNAEKFSFSPTTAGDAGGLCISADGRMIFFTACFRKDSRGSCDLYYSEKQRDGWTDPKNMGNLVNSDNWDAQPSISPDGKTLYFASNREGTLGSSDIWKTILLKDGSWSKPVNIGSPVNTADAEMAPFIHYDNNTLYFSSKGHLGMDGHDLFMSKRVATGWSEPRNLGYPINTPADELVIVVGADGRQAFISAELPGGHGGFDIYSFSLPEAVRPSAVTYMKGMVYDANTTVPLVADFELFDIYRDSLVMHSTSGKDGTFMVCLPVGRTYGLNVSCPGYLFYSDHFGLENIRDQADPFLKDIPMELIRIGTAMILKNIFFDTDQYLLKDESRAELNKLVSFLAQNPGICIEISGHTDNIGTDAYNNTLSERRAESVRDYLAGRGIDPQRLISAGYGFSMPVASNETEEGRAENRRTEIRITRVSQ